MRKPRTLKPILHNREFQIQVYKVFPKGLTHGFGPKMAIFPFFLGNLGQENVFYDILKKKKTPFQAIKTRSSKIRKIDILAKGLTHGFGPKNGHFSNLFVFRQYRPGKCLLRYSKTKKTPFQSTKTRCSKSRKINIFPKGLTKGFGPKMAIFPTFFFSGNICQQNVFYDILERKNAVLGYKNKKFKTSQT